jgi:hypothetical protein
MIVHIHFLFWGHSLLLGPIKSPADFFLKLPDTVHVL